ncbi:MAG: D-amino acid dehydrogenase [Candidatus Competibacteraceae bacterium]|nr:D-amino acid dehydrogenase [Candidatus Competibacteraceae bacterium]
MKILVMGSGIIGLASAWYLSQLGYKVLVLDKARGPAEECSFANGGQLSYSYTEPLATPGFLKTLPGLMLSGDRPVAIHPRSLPGLIAWSIRFLKECNAERYAENTTHVLRLALHSRETLDALREEMQLDFAYRNSGKLHLYATDAGLKKATRTVILKNRYGCAQQVLDPEQCLECEPALGAIRNRIAGGIFSPLDASGDAYRFSLGLMESCRKARVQFDFNTQILKLLKDGSRISGVQTNYGVISADAYVVCLGAQSPLVTKDLGISLPIFPGKGYSITFPAGPHCPLVNITDTSYRLVYSRLGSHLRVAGVMEFVGYNLAVKEKRLQRMIKRARTSFPQGGDYAKPSNPWVGLRPLTPDSAPIISGSPYDNLYFNTGHGMLGWTLACGSATLLTDLLTGNDSKIPTTAFDLQRFQDKT